MRRRTLPLIAQVLLPALFALTALSGCSGCSNGGGDNTAPTIALDAQSELTVTVGSMVIIEVQGSDADGDALTFEYETRTENDLSTLSTAMWFPSPNNATFRWTPDSADVTGDTPLELIFIVKDDRGGYVDRKVTLNVRPGNGDPRFVGSFNELYKDCCDAPLSIEISVRDDDSESVELQMKEAPTGAEFTPIGKMGSISRGRFLWTPDATQATQRVHNAVFVANDGTSQPIEQRLTIIIPPEGDFGIDLRNDSSSDAICAGDHIIDYVRHPEGRVNLSGGTAGNLNSNSVLIKAKLSDSAKSTYDELFLDWNLKDPLTTASDVPFACEEDPRSPACEMAKELERMREEQEQDALQIEQSLAPDGTYSWTIGYELYFGDDQSTHFYRVCAVDKERDADDPDQIVCSPRGKQMFHSFHTYRDEGAACHEEGAEQFGGGNDDFSTAMRVGLDSWTRGFTCPGNPDFYEVEVKPGSKLKPSVVFDPDEDVQIKLYDADRDDISAQLDAPSCGGIVSAEFEVPASASESQIYYFEVRGNEAIYHVQTIALIKAPDDACVDDAVEPNDSTDNATVLPADAKDYAICTGEDVDLYKVDLDAGQTLDLTMRFDASNIADMTLFTPSQSSEISKTSTGDAFTFEFSAKEEPLSYTARECGTHYLLVFSADGASSGDYSLESALGQATCQDQDQFASECHHSITSAKLVPPEVDYQNLTLCPGGEDWFRRSGSGGLSFLGEVTANAGSVTDLLFEIYDQDGERLATSTPSAAGGLDLEFTFPDDDFYFIRVASTSSDTPTDYNLVFALF